MNGTIDTRTVSLDAPTYGATGRADFALARAPVSLHRAPRHDNTSTIINPIWSDFHTSALDTLMRAVDDSSVFAALTGPRGSGTSEVLSRLLVASERSDRVCVAIRTPHLVSAKTVDQLNQSIIDAISSLTGRSVHLLFVIDEAHTASQHLLGLLDRVARKRDFRTAPQVVVAGEPSLWERLATPHYDAMSRRFAVRCSLPGRGEP